MIDDEVSKLVKEYGLTDQQAVAIRIAMASYAVAAIMDSSIANEAEDVCQEENTKP